MIREQSLKILIMVMPTKISDSMGSVLVMTHVVCIPHLSSHAVCMYIYICISVIYYCFNFHYTDMSYNMSSASVTCWDSHGNVLDVCR